MVGGIAIDFVGGHVDKGGFGTGLTRGFEEIECADGVGVKVVEGDARGEVVRGLGGCVYDGVGFYLGQEFADARAVADVYFVVVEVFCEIFQTLLIPARVSLGTKKDGALVVVYAVDDISLFGEIDADFRAYEARGSRDEEGFHGCAFSP